MSNIVDSKECGRILKQAAPIIGITIDKFEELFAYEYQNITGNNGIYAPDTYHGYFNGKTWPFYAIGINECLQIMDDILKRQTQYNQAELEEKSKKIKKIVHVAFTDWDNLTHYVSESDLKGEQNRTDHQNHIEWVMRDIEGLTLETRYVLDRYFNAFASFDEDCQKCLDLIDEYQDIERLIEVHAKDTFKFRGNIFFEALNHKELSEWLELRDSKSKVTDATRKKKIQEIAKIKQSTEKKLMKLKLSNLVFLHNFIRYIIEKRRGSFFNIRKKELNFLIFYKYWLRYEDTPSIMQAQEV